MKHLRNLKIFLGVLLFSAPMFGTSSSVPVSSIDGYTGATTTSKQKSTVSTVKVKAKAKKKASKAVLVTSSPKAVVKKAVSDSIDFDTYFTDQTLRLDYVFAGDIKTQSIYLSNLYSLPGWAGRRHHLSELPLDGTYQLTVKDAITKKIIYRYSFSSLFIEWLDTEEARHVPRAFPNTYLIPFPKQKIEVSIAVREKSGQYTEKIHHEIDPTDILIRPLGERKAPSHEVIQQAGPSDQCIDLAFLPEGYTEAQMDTFVTDVKKCCESLFSYEPFKSNKDRFNVVAVKTPSRESGVSQPKLKDWKDNAFGSHFDTFYSDRYLTSSAIPEINNALAGIPYEQIIVLGNCSRYGGGGVYNSFTLCDAHDVLTPTIVVHEFGHTFGGLADEYYYATEQVVEVYPRNVEPWEPNITTQVNFASKWKDLYDKGVVGLHEGGGYSQKGVWRPMLDCRMNTNKATEFCPVCQRGLQRIIDFYTR